MRVILAQMPIRNIDVTSIDPLKYDNLSSLRLAKLMSYIETITFTFQLYSQTHP